MGWAAQIPMLTGRHSGVGRAAQIPMLTGRHSGVACSWMDFFAVNFVVDIESYRDA